MKIEAYVTFVHDRRLDEILSILRRIELKEAQTMAIGTDILAKVTAESTLIDGVIALLNGLVANGTIDDATKNAIFAAIQSDTDKLNAALAANTPPPPPTP